MDINWKLRFQNKATLTAIVLGVVALVYQILGLLGITPAVSENEIINIVGMVINLLVLLGVVVDPTTAGVGDSDLAKSYDQPKG
jgi:phi LC3 family holin